MLIVTISLRKIPERSRRLIIAAPAQNAAASMLVDKLIRPLPHVADQVHDSVRTRARGMSAYRIRATHGAAVIDNRNAARIPSLAPGIEATVGFT